MRLVIGKDKTVAKWVSSKIPPMRASPDAFGPCAGIGVVDKNNNEIAGIVFHDYQPPPLNTIQMSFAATSPRWATKNMVATLLFYAFQQDKGPKVQKLWSAIQHTNLRALRVAAGLGFKREAVLKHHFGRGNHAVIFRMFSEDYRRIYGVKDGR